ncbi:hypothetical protein [Streptomyces sp. NPDC007172]|uniref:hypothetical protein n=1 Tax=Streptomyces sp. NPDC007172 TaxID=3364776 RepID=UPI0036AFFEEC
MSEPIPWSSPLVRQAGTVHLGGTHAEIVRTEAATAAGERVDAPFVLVVDPAVTDPSRTSGGKRPVWAYAHVPNGDTRDPVGLIRRRIEEYAPGFSDTVIASRGLSAMQYEMYNPNYVGGDIASGAHDPAPVTGTPHRAPGPVHHTAAGRVPLLVGHSTRAVGARHVRLFRGPVRPA